MVDSRSISITYKIPNISPRLIEVRRHFLVGLSKYRSPNYALSTFIQYPNYTQRIANVSPGVKFGDAYIR